MKNKAICYGAYTAENTLCAGAIVVFSHRKACLLYTSDAADERSSVDLGGRRIIKKKKKTKNNKNKHKNNKKKERK